MTISPSIDKRELSIRIVKNSEQLIDDYVLWHQSGWTDEEFGQLLGISSKTVKNRYLADARKQGLIEQHHNSRSKQNTERAQNRARTVENSDQEIEQVDVEVHEPAVAAAAVQRPFAPVETPAPVSVSAVKRPSKPKDLQMLDSQQRKINERLLPIAKQLMDLLGQVKEEKDRLHGRWVKDNIVFATGFQRCADYWNDCNYFTEFAEVLDDDRIKTYSDVLATIEQRAKRITDHMKAIQYATGCTADPNKKDL